MHGWNGGIHEEVQEMFMLPISDHGVKVQVHFLLPLGIDLTATMVRLMLPLKTGRPEQSGVSAWVYSSVATRER